MKQLRMTVGLHILTLLIAASSHAAYRVNMETARELDVSIYVAADFPEVATPAAKGYKDQIWFSAVKSPAVVYCWFVPGS